MTTTKPRRRWFQFRLRTLLVLMLLSCLVIGWLSGDTDYLLAMGLETVRSPEWWLRWQGGGLLSRLSVVN